MKRITHSTIGWAFLVHDGERPLGMLLVKDLETLEPLYQKFTAKERIGGLIVEPIDHLPHLMPENPDEILDAVKLIIENKETR